MVSIKAITYIFPLQNLSYLHFMEVSKYIRWVFLECGDFQKARPDSDKRAEPVSLRLCCKEVIVMISMYKIQKEIIENKSTFLHLNHSYKNLTIDNTTSVLIKKNVMSILFEYLSK